MGKTPKQYKQVEAKLAKTVKEKPSKNPKVPTFPRATEAIAQKLREKIDAGGEQATLAYGALSRLCVMWAPGSVSIGPMGSGQYGEVVREYTTIMDQLFPDGEGLPDPE